MARHDADHGGGLLRVRGDVAAPARPLRHDRVPSRRFRLSDFRTTIASVLTARDLRRLSFACFAFNGVQSVFTAYFVTYLVALGYELAAAGFLFSLVVAVAMPCRILWGWIGSFYVTPRLVMAGLALGMAGSVALTGLFTPAWPVAAMGLVGGRAQRHRDVVARHPALRNRPPRPAWQRRRRNRRRFVVRSDRGVSGPVCFLSAAGADGRLRGRVGPMRSSRTVGGRKPFAPPAFCGRPRGELTATRAGESAEAKGKPHAQVFQAGGFRQSRHRREPNPSREICWVILLYGA